MRDSKSFLAVLAISGLSVAAYGAFAVYFDRTYVDPRPVGRKVRLLPPPFELIGGFYVKYGPKVEPGTVVYEDKEPLDPLPDGEGYRGPGHFHVLPNGIGFLPTDGSDPNTSGRRYWLVKP